MSLFHDISKTNSLSTSRLFLDFCNIMDESNSPSVKTLINKTYINSSLIAQFNETSLRTEINEYIRQINYWLLIAEFIMVVCGTVGNCLALIVINRRPLRHTTSCVFITYLAIFDTLVLAVHLTGLITLRSIKSFVLHCFFTYLTDFITFPSVWIIVIMTIERYITVHSPLCAKRICTVQHARYSVYLLIFIASMFFSITFPFIYTVDKIQQKCGILEQYQTLIRIVKPIIFYFIPDIILLLNLLIVYELFATRRRRAQTLVNPENATRAIDGASFNRKQQQLTVMLLTVSLSFYLFTTPAIVDYILQRYPPKYRDIKRLKMRILRGNLTVLWLQMSSAVSSFIEQTKANIFNKKKQNIYYSSIQTNFLLYCLAGSKFRAICCETLSDIYDYVRKKLDGNYHQRRSFSSVRANSNFGIQMRDGFEYDYCNKFRSTSLRQTYTYQLSNSSKRLSHDTVLTSQVNGRRTSKSIFNV